VAKGSVFMGSVGRMKPTRTVSAIPTHMAKAVRGLVAWIVAMEASVSWTMSAET